jgi:DNA-binding response OmpR family regulator
MGGETVSVLLVEDNPGDAELFQEYLSAVESPRFRVHHRDNLAAGLVRLGFGGIDVLILDLSLPDSRGINTVLRVRQDSPDVPIVVLTGMDDEELAVEAVQKGAQDYLVKSRVDDGALVRSIRYAVQRHRIQHGIRQARKEHDTREMQALRNHVGAVLSPVPLDTFTPGLLTDEQARSVARSLGTILDGVVGPRTSAAGAGITPQLRTLAQELGKLNAGPRDVMEVYTRCLQERLSMANPEQRQAYEESGLPLALEAMGHLVAYYRGPHVA